MTEKGHLIFSDVIGLIYDLQNQSTQFWKVAYQYQGQHNWAY
jgi:hypothetical protein